MKLKKGDNVIIIAGKDKGKKGKITQIIKETNRVVVEGANISKKHQRSRRKDAKGQIVEVSMPLNASNVMILDSKNKPTRIGYKIVGDKKVRIGRKSGTEIKD